MSAALLTVPEREKGLDASHYRPKVICKGFHNHLGLKVPIKALHHNGMQSLLADHLHQRHLIDSKKRRFLFLY